MREVLASLKPYYYYLVGEGIKEVEVRKSMPKASDWDNEVLFYMSKDEKSFAKIPKEFQEKYRKHFGKVGMQFVCDRIDKIGKRGADNNFDYCYLSLNEWGNDDIEIEITTIKKSCITKEELNKYGSKSQYLYGLHISDLKIYDKPKPIMQFYKPCPIEIKNCPGCEFYSEYTGCCMNNVTRPPESWCYIEEL